MMLLRKVVESSVCLATFLPNVVVAATLDEDRVAGAIKNRVCYEIYWWDRQGYNLGRKARFSIRTADDTVYAWSENLQFMPNTTRWANLFVLRKVDENYFVSVSKGFNEQTMKGVPQFEESKKASTAAGAKEISIRMPESCAPRFASNSQPKQDALRSVESAVGEELRSVKSFRNVLGVPSITVIIGNSYPGDPLTYVYVPRINQILSVDIGSHYAKEQSEPRRNAPYAVGVIYGRGEFSRLRKKILAFGIARTIRVDDK